MLLKLFALNVSYIQVLLGIPFGFFLFCFVLLYVFAVQYKTSYLLFLNLETGFLHAPLLIKITILGVTRTLRMLGDR